MIKPHPLFAVVLTAASLFCSPICHADLPVLTVLHTFAPGGPGDMVPAHDINSGGSHPESPLTQGRDGVLYGTTESGGIHGTGVIFKVNSDGTGFTVLHSFQPLERLFVNETNVDGCWPEGALVFGSDGALYGVASQGGPGGSGTVFKLKPDGSSFTVLHSFEPKGEHWSNSGGAHPEGLTPGPDQTWYGVTELGGEDGKGLIFQMAQDGKDFHIIHTFYTVAYEDNTNKEGAIPTASMTIGRDGAFYGTTNIGGKSGYGVIYKMDPNGKRFTVLHNFQRKTKDNGVFPSGSLILSADNYLYGCTRQGGAGDGGIAYKVSTGGLGFTILHTFSDPFTESTDGWSPSPLVFGTDRRLYGVSGGSGKYGQDMLFKVSTDGAKFFLLHDFSKEGGSSGASLTPGPDGSFYGISTNGGANGTGTIFQMTLPSAK